MEKAAIKLAFRDSLPVLAGYVAIGIGFGVLMSTNGYGIGWSVLMSVFIYAGSMQYAAVGLLTGGVSLLTVAITTLAINARHLFYGISMADKYKNAGALKPYMIFALTDETYSIVCTSDKGHGYCFFVSLFNHIYWISGTLIGGVIGETVKFNTMGIDFSMTALFIVVFVEQWLSSKDHFPAVIGVLASVLSLLVFGSDSFLIPAMISIAVILLLRMGKEDKND